MFSFLDETLRKATKRIQISTDVEYLASDQFMSSLPDDLLSILKAILGTEATENGDQFEILTRNYVLLCTSKLLDANHVHDDAVMEEAILELLEFVKGCIDICIYIAKKPRENNGERNALLTLDSLQLRKLPFLLLEDAFDSLPLVLTRVLWKYSAAEWLPKICDENVLFNQGSKYVLIRIANKLLKSLFVNADNQAASFAGEISMTLANVFPLSERSAVNVLGSFHIENIVKYESIDEWKSNKGSENEHHQVTMNYDLYSKYWGLQKVFTNPKELLPLGSQVWSDEIEAFITDANIIMASFEQCSFKPDLVKRLKSRWNKTKQMLYSSTSKNNGLSYEEGDVEMVHKEEVLESVESIAAARQYKYLTSSQLLELQLQDPEFRVHFLTQLIIISRYLASSLASFMVTSAGSNLTTKMICEKHQVSIRQLESRAAISMRTVPPNGDEHCKTLEWILSERESMWRQWKKNRCEPSIERFESKDPSKSAVKAESSNTASTVHVSNIIMNSETYSYHMNIKVELPAVAKDLSRKGKNINQYLEEFADALDPDAGIEEEYHPRRNKLSSWRALRDLARGHIGHFGDNDNMCMISKRNGDFEGIVRKIWREEKGILIPGEIPQSENVFDDYGEEADVEQDIHVEETTGNDDTVSQDNFLDHSDVNSQKDYMDEGEIDEEAMPMSNELESNDTDDYDVKDYESVSDSKSNQIENQYLKSLDIRAEALLDTASHGKVNEPISDERNDSTICEIHPSESKNDSSTNNTDIDEKQKIGSESSSRKKRSRSSSVDKSVKIQKVESNAAIIVTDSKEGVKNVDSNKLSKDLNSDSRPQRDDSLSSNRYQTNNRLPPTNSTRRHSPPVAGNGPLPQRGPPKGNFRGPPQMQGGGRGRDDRGSRGTGWGDDRRNLSGRGDNPRNFNRR